MSCFLSSVTACHAHWFWMIKKLPSWFTEYKYSTFMHLATVDRLKTNTIHVNSKLNSHFLGSQTVNTGVNIVVDSSIMLELQQSIFTILVSAVCLHFVQAELCFLLAFAVFPTLTRNRMIVYFGAKQPTRVADKNIFASDLIPSCWITGHEETECILKNKTKLEPNHSADTIHSSLWILDPAHSMNAMWNTCTVQWHSEFSRRSEKGYMQYDTKVCSSPCVVLL